MAVKIPLLLGLFLSRNRRVAVTLFIIAVFAIAISALYLTQFNLNKIIQKPMPIPLVSIAGNWAGYEVFSNLLSPQSTVQAVSASWIVPSVKDIGADTYSSVWVGISGQFDHTLIQVGTEQDFTGGSANYYVWYEMLPNNAVPIASISLSPGDEMQASISLVDSNNNVWSISIEDLTNHGSFQSNFTYNSQKLTAEWIVERPEINNALTQLADFGSVSFSNCNANLAGKTGGITAFPYNDVIMSPQIINNHSVQLVSVSGTKNSGTQFTVNYISR